MKLRELISEIHHDYTNMKYDTETSPLKAGDTITVYHGYNDYNNAILTAKYGISGAEKANRVYSYEFDNIHIFANYESQLTIKRPNTLRIMTYNVHGFKNAIDYYGSYLGIQDKFRVNITDDMEYLRNSDFFIISYSYFEIDIFYYLLNILTW